MKKLKIYFLHFLIYWLPFIVWAVVIFSFSSNPTVKTSEVHWQDFFIKKTAHVVEYFVFSLLLYRGMINSGMKSKNIILIVVLTTFLYGLTDEFHQSFTPGREPKLRDVLIDLSGSIIFFFSLKKIVPRSRPLSEIIKMLQLA